MKDCIFCRIVDGQQESERVLETKQALAFLDINPRAPGHTLIIPKDHARTLTDLDPDPAAGVFLTTRRICTMIEDALNPEGFTIGINDGPEAGQEIPHLHVNVIPRFKGDGGTSVHSVVQNPPVKDLSEIAEKIRDAGLSDISSRP